MLRHAPRTQEEKLPLHYAVENSAPLEVVAALLKANPGVGVKAMIKLVKAHASEHGAPDGAPFKVRTQAC